MIQRMKSRQLVDQPVQKTTQSRPHGVRAVVQCGSFRCLAFKDDNGKWIDYYTREELKDVKAVVFRCEW
jgi:hypothetical protein